MIFKRIWEGIYTAIDALTRSDAAEFRLLGEFPKGGMLPIAVFADRRALRQRRLLDGRR